MKVGQTFLSAVLIAGLSECRQKKGFRRLYSVGATGRSPLRVVAQSGLCWVFRDRADEAPILSFAAYHVVIEFLEPERLGDTREFKLIQ